MVPLYRLRCLKAVQDFNIDKSLPDSILLSDASATSNMVVIYSYACKETQFIDLFVFDESCTYKHFRTHNLLEPWTLVHFFITFESLILFLLFSEFP